MVPVVFTNKCSRQKSQHDFRTGQANEAYKLLERNPVIPVRQRLQDVLRRRVLAAEKPHVGDAQRGERVARFDLADDAERRGLLGSGFIRDRKSTRLNSSHTVISYAVFCLKKKN